MKLNKKILWVNPSFLDYRIPVYKELNNLLNKQFHIIYSKIRVPDRVNFKIKEDLKENSHGFATEKLIKFGKQGNFANEGYSIPYQKGLLKLILDIKPDIIITEGFFQWSPIALFASFLTRKPLWVAYERTKHTERESKILRRIYRKIFSYFTKGFLVNGVETEQYLQDVLKIKNKPIIRGCMSADSTAISSKVNTLNENVKSELYKQLKIINNKGLIFLFIGQITRRKGINELINAWSDHANKYTFDTLIIIGEGDLEEDIKMQCKQIESVRFMGPIDYDNIYEFYAISNVFILPTLEDNWSLVIPEAMACGMPIATTPYNGCHPELLINGKNGFLFDSLNHDSFVDVFGIFHKIDLKEFGRVSKNIELDFSPKKVAKNIFDGIFSNNFIF